MLQAGKDDVYDVNDSLSSRGSPQSDGLFPVPARPFEWQQPRILYAAMTRRVMMSGHTVTLRAALPVMQSTVFRVPSERKPNRAAACVA